MAGELISRQVYTDPATVAAAEGAKARIQAAYVMAIQNKRNEDEARDRILKSCRRPAFAERVEYSKPVGNKKIKGPSIRFAELALREWGNIRSDCQVVYEDETFRRSQITITDLETNATFSKEVQIVKTVERKKPGEDREVMGERINTSGEKVFIVAATEEELFNKEAAAISKALRNEGLRLIPSDIIDEAIETARTTMRDRDSKDPAAAKKRLLDSFSSIGVTPKEIERFLGHKTDALVPVELEELRKMYRAISDGEARWQDYTNQEARDAKPTPPDLEKIKAFDEAMKDADAEKLAAYLQVCADHFKITVDEVKAGATDIKAFTAQFAKWVKAQGEKDKITKEPIRCPNDDTMIDPSACPNCKHRDGCPAWG